MKPVRERLARALARIAALPPALRAVLAAAAVLHGLGLSWGLPASDAWDNDGIAPRDILPGLASTFTPGQFFTYPPAHLALLAALTAPVTAIAALRAPTTRVPDVVAEILAAPYMTAFALTARIVALLMSLGIALALAEIAMEIHAREPARAARIGTFTAAISSAGVTFTYYAHTSNLDVPYLFWGSLAALSLVRAAARREPERLRRTAVLAAVAVATKDQAYALFLVAVPLALAWWVACDAEIRKPAVRRRLLREALVSAGIGLAVLLVLDGALFNPSGFRARIAFLRGPASQDFSNYAAGAEGRVAIVLQIGREIHRHYPPVFALLMAIGLVRAVRARAVVGLVPAFVAVSFTVGFNFAARRIDDRFVLPQMLFLAVYAGAGLEWLWARGGAGGRSLALRGACFFLLGLEVWEALRVDFTLLFEPRYATERFLAAHVRDGDTIEVHGLNAYLPRFPPRGRVVRVGPTPPHRRGPLPAVEEVQAPFLGIGERRPRFVVVSTCFAWRYLEVDTASRGGEIYPTGQLRLATDRDATSFFQGLFAGRLGYRMVHDAKIKDGWFRPIEIHASLNCRTTTFERQGE